MSRPLRVECGWAYFHLMNRGRLFSWKGYFKAFLDTLVEAHERFELENYAYCLMGNHHHLRQQQPLDSVAQRATLRR